MVAALAAAQPLDTSKVDLKDFCAVGQPDHDERGDLLVRYRDDPSFKAIATKLHPMLVDLKVGGRGDNGWVGACVHVSVLFWGGACSGVGKGSHRAGKAKGTSGSTFT